jgi:hypothetical protein
MSFSNYNQKIYQSDDIQFKVVSRSHQEYQLPLAKHTNKIGGQVSGHKKLS